MDHLRLEGLKKKELIDLISNRGLTLERQLDQINSLNNPPSNDKPIEACDDNSVKMAFFTEQLNEVKARLDATEKKLLENSVKLISTESIFEKQSPQIELIDNKLQNIDQQPFSKLVESKAIISNGGESNERNIFIKIGASAQFFCETSLLTYSKDETKNSDRLIWFYSVFYINLGSF